MTDIKKLTAKRRDELAGAQLRLRDKKSAAQSARRKKKREAGEVQATFWLNGSQGSRIRETVDFLTKSGLKIWAVCEASPKDDKTGYKWLIAKRFGEFSELPAPAPLPATEGTTGGAA